MNTLRSAAVHATLAPSVYRTEPWHLVLSDTSLEIRADWSRQLRALDPAGRQLVISCGSALVNAETTIAAAGRPVLIERLPDAHDPDLLARLTLGGSGGDSSPVEEVSHHVVSDPDQLLLAGRLDRLALLEQESDPARHAELRAWRPRSRPGGGTHHEQRMVVLGTTRDDPLAWLRTGEELQRLVLDSQHELSVRSLPHVIESPRIREQLRAGLELDVQPQAVLLLGPPVTFSPSRSRRLVDVLSVTSRPGRAARTSTNE